MAALTQQTAVPSSERARPARRPEIDGLRAVAVALVVLYHVATGRVSGGVDVFLVLSGFFLVHSLTGQVRRTGRVRVLTSVARTLSRLAPAAVLVLAVTAAASAWVVPASRRPEIAAHLLSSVTATENVRLVREAVDYNASNAAASPFQQFWSLSIQVQVLLAVPVVVAVGAAALHGRRGAHRARPAVVVTVAAVTAVSLVWSVLSTAADQQTAYFSTAPRLWEVGVGALVALVAAGVRPRGEVAWLLGWGGLLALVACGTVLDGAHTFPGWQAAWPVLCAVAIVVAGDAGGRLGVHRLLSLSPMRWLGARSYVLYLWHWPVLVLYLVHREREAPSLAGAVAVVGLSLVLAAGTHGLLERPAGDRLQVRRPAVALVLVAACVVPVGAAGALATAWFDREAARTARLAEDPAYPGAVALRSTDPSTGGLTGVDPIPPATVIRDDWPGLPESTCTTEEEGLDPVPAVIEICVQGSDDRAHRVVVVGDSHAAQWLPPLGVLGDRHAWQVISIVRGGCNLSTESEFIQEGWPGFEECAAWRSRLVDRIVSLDPDLVVSLGTRTAPGPDREVLPPGFVAAWQQLADAGIRLIGLRDSPRHLEDVPECLDRSGDAAAACGSARADVYTDDVLEEAARTLPQTVDLLDTSSYFCTDEVCPALVGNVRVYMDSGHVTGTYMRTVAPLLEPDLLRLTGW